MGRASALLGHWAAHRSRLGIAAGALLVLFLYYWTSSWMPDVPRWADFLVISVGVAPLAFALVWLALPLRGARGLVIVALALAVLGATWQSAGWYLAAGLPKGLAAAALAFWFLSYFERLSWVVLVAAIVPLVDAFSVWRGPTNYIVTERPGVFSALSVGFPIPAEEFVSLEWEAPREGRPVRYVVRRLEPRPAQRSRPAEARDFTDGGEELGDDHAYVVEAVDRDGIHAASGRVDVPADGEPEITEGGDPRAPRIASVESGATTFNLGLPDVLFFTLFLGAAARWRLRIAATWVAMLVALGATMALALWGDPFGIGGLPALPGLSLAFLLANADLLWRRLRERHDDLAEAVD